ncbi:P-loop containing nucleoside triphosphate hydrolase protein, partial [Protomyces lactucae-debilis]
LTPRLQENLAKHGFTDAFAVQAALLPVLLERQLPEDRQDVLVSAPTGSGKTITYALPILQVLHTRRITALRALIIVPTRELVHQVQETFELLNTKVGLKIQSLSSARTLRAEQTLLVRDGSRVDILVCTPGRLVDHLQATPGFSLQHLRFLVIDEGDRLLNQSFHDWANKIEAALPRHTKSLQACSMERCQKLIFSATMNGDPGLLAQLHLTKPVLYNVREDAEKFSLPATLTEYFVNAPSDTPKPLVLLHVLKRLGIEKAIVFTNSTESAQRLAKLIAPFISCQAFTSIQTSSARQGLLKQFNDGAVQVLVASDLISRGLDTTTPVVINYASSIPARQYVHRVGRTARAGNKGLAISIVEPEEAKFW